jgi:hypothetical protein
MRNSVTNQIHNAESFLEANCSSGGQDIFPPFMESQVSLPRKSWSFRD